MTTIQNNGEEVCPFNANSTSATTISTSTTI
jgi:hypothetical protein